MGAFFVTSVKTWRLESSLGCLLVSATLPSSRKLSENFVCVFKACPRHLQLVELQTHILTGDLFDGGQVTLRIEELGNVYNLRRA